MSMAEYVCLGYFENGENYKNRKMKTKTGRQTGKKMWCAVPIRISTNCGMKQKMGEKLCKMSAKIWVNVFQYVTVGRKFMRMSVI